MYIQTKLKNSKEFNELQQIQKNSETGVRAWKNLIFAIKMIEIVVFYLKIKTRNKNWTRWNYIKLKS